jgi:pimeloyl-ACP methyl ester carboxylesterase
MSNQTIYLLPGLLCDESVWAYQKHGLLKCADVRVADFFGFDSLMEMAKDVLSKAPKTFSVVGHSMGARVALEILRLAPERVSRIALLDSGAHLPHPDEATARGALVEIARTQGMAALAAAWLPPMVHPKRLGDMAFMQSLTEMVCRATPESFAGQINALLNRPDGNIGLSKVRCPVLVGCGRQDMWAPLSLHEAIAAQIPHAALVVFEDSGHMSTVEAPDAVMVALLNWMAKEDLH